MALGKGDLSDAHELTYERDDEIKVMLDATNDLGSKLRSIMYDIHDVIGSMVAASKTTSRMAEILSNSANQQASSVEEVASTRNNFV